MPLPFIAQLFIGIALMVIGYLLMPRPKPPKPPEMKDADDPESKVKPIPMAFGTVVVKGSNILWFGNKRKVKRTISDSGGKK